jgi:hypothetical protein
MAQLTGHASLAPSGGTSEVFTTPFPIKKGTRMRDVDGNEYLFVDFTATISKGCWAVISDDNTASPLLNASVGRVGVVCRGGTSNNGGWVQIYGLCNFAQTSAVSDEHTTNRTLRTQTSVTSPSGTVGFVSLTSADTNINRIHGAYVTDLLPAAAGAAGEDGSSAASDTSWPVTYTSAVTNAGSGLEHTGLTLGVMLNYPHVAGIDTYGTT